MADAAFLPNRAFFWRSSSLDMPHIVFGACKCSSGVMQVSNSISLF